MLFDRDCKNSFSTLYCCGCFNHLGENQTSFLHLLYKECQATFSSRKLLRCWTCLLHCYFPTQWKSWFTFTNHWEQVINFVNILHQHQLSILTNLLRSTLAVGFLLQPYEMLKSFKNTWHIFSLSLVYCVKN